MIRIEDPLNEKGFRIMYWILCIGAFIGIFGMIPPRDGADVLVSFLCALIFIGTALQLYGFYRKNRKPVHPFPTNIEDATPEYVKAHIDEWDAKIEAARRERLKNGDSK
jgi:hypothetical protein